MENILKSTFARITSQLEQVCNVKIDIFRRITLNVIIYALIYRFDSTRSIELYDD